MMPNLKQNHNDASLEAYKIRLLIDRLCPTDASLDAFCIDHFPEVHKLFSSGMERTAKVNLLLVHCPLASVSGCLLLIAKVKTATIEGSIHEERLKYGAQKFGIFGILILVTAVLAICWHYGFSLLPKKENLAKDGSSSDLNRLDMNRVDLPKSIKDGNLNEIRHDSPERTVTRKKAKLPDSLSCESSDELREDLKLSIESCLSKATIRGQVVPQKDSLKLVKLGSYKLSPEKISQYGGEAALCIKKISTAVTDPNLIVISCKLTRQ